MVLRLRMYRFLLRAIVYPLPAVSFLVAAEVEFLSGARGHPRWDVPPYLLLLVLHGIVWAVAAEHYRLTSLDEIFRERSGARGVLAACTASFLVLLAAIFFYRGAAYSRLFLVVDGTALVPIAFFARTAFRLMLVKRQRKRKPLRILMVGADRFARRAAARLRRVPLSPCRIAGYVRLPGQEVDVPESELVDLDRCDPLQLEREIDDIVIAVEPARLPELSEILKRVEKLSLPVRAILDFGDGVVIRDNLFQFGRVQMLDLMSTPAESLDYTFLKRALDILFAAAVLPLCSPLLVLIALAIKLTSSGPLFFRQERVGLNGRTFQMYKFRTMCVASPAESDIRWTRAEDDRCTAVGALLRRTSLDELPQFWNVLKGDMSVVGPRPERPFFVHKFLRDVSQYSMRHRLKVGITGWAQVNGYRGDTSIQKRVEYDLYYLQNWSLVFDLRIIFLTLVSGLINKNAY
jgi:Undecaprenyl-phosphate glucose phosphotransferase